MNTEDKVRRWFVDRGIRKNSSPSTQFVKLLEEVSEVLAGINKNDLEEIKDGIGDTMVVLTGIADMYELTLQECYDHAYDQIKDRTGYLTPEGIFVKDK